VKAALDSATQGALNLFGTAAGSNAEIEEAKKNANDLSGLVRKKAKDDSKPEAAAADTATNGNGKRKAEEPADSEAATESKKAKVEDQAEEIVA
jgi:HAT1-interacting factor 1